MDAQQLLENVRLARYVHDEYTGFMRRVAKELAASSLQSLMIDANALSLLKRQLRDWDMHRACWKDRRR